MDSRKYRYKMGYVPLADEVYIPQNKIESAKPTAAAAQPEVNPSSLVNDVSLTAIQSMLSMCSMVYMMCLSVLGDEVVFVEEDLET